MCALARVCSVFFIPIWVFMAACGRRNSEMTLGFLALGALTPFSGAK